MENRLADWDKALVLSVGQIVLAVNWLADHFNWRWRLDLYPDWRHIYLLMQLYFLADAAQFGEAGLSKARWASRGIGFPIALVSAVFAGRISPSTHEYANNFLIGLYPILGFFIYALTMAYLTGIWHRPQFADHLGKAETLWEHVSHRWGLAVLRVTIAIFILAVGLLFVTFDNASLFMLAIAWVAFAIEILRRGWAQAKSRVARKSGSLLAALLETGNIQLSMSMLATGGLAAAVVALDQVAAAH